MLPPYGEFTLILSLVLSLISGLLISAATRKTSKVYTAALIIAVPVSCLVEAYGSSRSFFYDFGDHLIHHFAVAFLASIALHFALLVVIEPIKALFTGSVNSPSAKAYVPHALGLLNISIPVGTVAIAIYWALNRKHHVLAAAARQAFTFQLAYTLLICLIPFLMPSTGKVVETLWFVPLIMIIAWLALTIVAIFKARSNPHYSYPLLGRFNASVSPADTRD